MNSTLPKGPALHLDLDRAWTDEPLGLPRLDARAWGPPLRFSAPPRVIEKFYDEIGPRLPPFVLYGSGDFHHLSGLWVRHAPLAQVVVSFDNHPDWDIRPPKWCAGSWVNRALALPQVERVSVWGCGNFECWWPTQFWGNRRAEARGELEVHPWADDRPASDQTRRGAIRQGNWRDRFADFARTLAGRNVYVTIDLDCLRADEAVTNWENGRFTVADVIWALGRLRETASIVAGDMCGAYSPPRYARWKQKFASEIDHPKLSRPAPDEIRRINFATLEKLWPVLVKD
jgi:hypothetical protein